MPSLHLSDGADRALPSSVLSSARPHLVLLPGRTRWLHTCHLNPVECDDCLGRVAEFLARELGFDLGRALDRTTLNYQAELGGDVCSLERANVLRRLTCQACMPAHSALGVNLGIVVARGANGQARVVSAPREFFCEAQDLWISEPCGHAECGAEVVEFPGKATATAKANTGVLRLRAARSAQDDSSKGEPVWQAWAKWVVSFLLLPLVLLFGAGAVVVLVLALLFGGEAEV
jgi:hypothetical protein